MDRVVGRGGRQVTEWGRMLAVAAVLLLSLSATLSSCRRAPAAPTPTMIPQPTPDRTLDAVIRGQATLVPLPTIGGTRPATVPAQEPSRISTPVPTRSGPIRTPTPVPAAPSIRPGPAPTATPVPTQGQPRPATVPATSPSRNPIATPTPRSVPAKR